MKNNLLTNIVFVFLIVIFIVEVSWLTLSNPNIKNAITLAATHQPEVFTELYFEDHANLPKLIRDGEQYRFSFTVHNLENRDAIYPYTVYIQRGNIKVVVDQGIITIKNNDFKSVQETIGPLSPFRKEVVVNLTGLNQSISFWMDK